MPPPTAVDSWLASRRFGVVIDAGSSGSRLQIYSWKDARMVRDQEGQAVYNSLPTVEKGTREGDSWIIKAEPGLSSFAGNPEGVVSYLAPLLEHARTQIPPSLQPETPLFLLATAGMRLLAPTQQADVLQATCNFLKFHSHFRIDEPSEAGPCGSSVRIITGEEEGLFGWIAINYLMDGFNGAEHERTTYGFLDMGGASTQIAFEPSEEERQKTKDLIDVRLRLLGGQEIHHQVFVTTWLGYGTNQARERYVGKTINEFEANRAMSHPSPVSDDDTVPDPCLPKDLHLTELPVQPASSSTHSKQAHELVGTGSFEQCLQQTAPLLNKDAPCPDAPCLFNGIHVPPIDFSVSHFIGVSEYWYSSEHVFGLGGPYDVVQYERAASEFCSRDWSHIMQEHEESRRKGTLGGDGEVLKDGQVVSTGRWGDKVEVSRLQMQCFKAAWLVNVLHEGIGLPRIVDAGGNATTDGQKIAQQAEDKGLGKPQFQSMDSVGDIAITWTLGKMVLEASKEVPPAPGSTRPLVDPIDDIPGAANSPVKPIRPPFIDFDSIEDQLAPHLPPSLTRHALGFSPVSLLFYVVVMTFIIVTLWRLRHRIRSTARRFIRKKDRDWAAEGYAMEEGHSFANSFPPSRPPSPPSRGVFRLLDPIRRVASLSSRQPPRPVAIQVTSPEPRSGQSSPVLRSPSFPDFFSTSGTAPGSPRLYNVNIVANGSLTSLTSRSRNSSRMDLPSLMPRPLSRSNSTI
ncbi:nucleoside phosphatase family-domain-containing protein [Irpex rosettiformis]|uniref:Nucleoside phosphatase family-domain-containing protein n=1 Tax=Irpex rosettiformis TaxID=378272 RepID=A0ACB8UHN7_9APHY|nr:nucleoside phosphatase family-domain-containing protein [Irpex rosettiformis]